MLNYVHNMKLKTKIFISCTSIVILAILSLSQFMYTYVSKQNTEVFYENSSDMLVQASSYLDEKLKAIMGRVYAMMVNADFDKTIKDYLFNEEPNFKALALSQMSGAFSEVRSSDDFISSIFLYTPKGGFFDLARTINYNYDFTSTELYKMAKAFPNANLYWGRRRTDNVYSGQKHVIPLVLRLNIEGYNGDVFLVINLSEQAILDYLTGIQKKPGNQIFIIDNNGEEVVVNDAAEIKALMENRNSINEILDSNGGITKKTINSKGYIITYQNTKVAPWKIVSLKSEKALMDRMKSFKLYVFVLSLVSIVLCFILALLFAGSITKPLGILRKTIKEVTKRNFDIRFDYKYENEFGDLGKSFNFMITEIKDLIEKLDNTIVQLREEKDRVRIEQLLKRRAELKALQAQINPHFLYNTLDSINWLANSINATEISRMTSALATLFRTGLSRGQELITLREEISHVSSYLVIQQIRYGDKFEYNINIDEGLLELYNVKLVLQPLVENAIYHGIKDKDGPGIINISGSITEESVELLVEDNGLGINKLNLNLINRRLKEGVIVDKQGYGIYNVNERLKLYFGENYGLVFFSEPGHGTRAKVIIPAVRNGDIEKYVQIVSSR